MRPKWARFSAACPTIVPSFVSRKSFSVAVMAMLLSACATSPDGRHGKSLFDLSWLFSDSPTETVEQGPTELVIDVDDPSVEEEMDLSVRNEGPTGGFGEIPVIGPILAALFSQGTNLPEDEELAQEAPIADLVSAQNQRIEALLRPSEVDAEPPILKLLYERNGRLQAFGPTVAIRGTANDDTGVAEVSVNGQLVQLRSNAFSHRINVPFGLSVARIVATDTAGNKAVRALPIVRRSDRATRRRVTSNVTREPPPVSALFRTRPAVLAAEADPMRVVQQPGVYMVLLSGTPLVHVVRMPTLDQCKQAVAFSQNAACTELHQTGPLIR